MLRIWGRRSAFNVQKVLWLLGELARPHEHVDVGGDAGGLDTPEFLARNPHGRVPVLEDGDVSVWESHSILRYLAARYASDPLWPDDPAMRSHADRWMDWAQATLQPAFMALFWGHYRTPAAQRDPRHVERAREACAELFGLLDAQLASRPYLAGDAFTLGDIPAGTALYRYFELGLSTPALPHVRAWYARLGERPAYRAHVMRPFDELRGKLAF